QATSGYTTKQIASRWIVTMAHIKNIKCGISLIKFHNMCKPFTFITIVQGWLWMSYLLNLQSHKYYANSFPTCRECSLAYGTVTFINGMKTEDSYSWISYVHV